MCLRLQSICDFIFLDLSPLSIQRKVTNARCSWWMPSKNLSETSLFPRGCWTHIEGYYFIILCCVAPEMYFRISFVINKIWTLSLMDYTPCEGEYHIYKAIGIWKWNWIQFLIVTSTASDDVFQKFINIIMINDNRKNAKQFLRTLLKFAYYRIFNYWKVAVTFIDDIWPLSLVFLYQCVYLDFVWLSFKRENKYDNS